MPTITNLSLRIYGGPLNQGLNPTALVAVGAAPEGFRPMPPAIVDEPQAWMITHTQGYTAYALSTRDCQTATGQPAQMLVVLFMPPQQKLQGTGSPLGLLNIVAELFRVQNMPADRLPADQTDGSSLQAVLRRYQLEERPTLLPVMTGSEPASFRAENITQVEALMRYSRYPALARVARLEIGLSCPTTIDLPMKSGSQAKTAQNAPSKPAVTTPPPSHKPTVSTPSDKPSSVSKPAVEPSSTPNRPVDSHTQKSPLYEVVFEWRGASKTDYEIIQKEIRNKHIQLMFDGKDASDFVLDKEAMIAADIAQRCKVSISPFRTSRYTMSVEKQLYEKQRLLRIIITVGKLAKSPLIDQTNSSAPDNHSKTPEPSNSKEKVRFLLIGLILGLILGIGGTLIISEMMGEKEKAPEAPVVEGEKEDVREIGSPIDSTAIGETATDTEVKVQEEADRKAKEEADKKTKEEADRKAKEEADKKAIEEADRKAKEEAKRKADEEVDKMEKLAKKQAESGQKVNQEKGKQEILDMLNKGIKIGIIRGNKAWASLSDDERLAVENICKYKQSDVGGLKNPKKTMMKNLLKNKKINNWEEVINTRTEIIRILNN